MMKRYANLLAATKFFGDELIIGAQTPRKIQGHGIKEIFGKLSISLKRLRHRLVGKKLNLHRRRFGHDRR
jgi:hypothetical protein